MTAIKYDSVIAVFQILHFLDVVHRSCVCHNPGVIGRGRIQSHYAKLIGLVIVAERLGKRAEVWFIEVTQRVIWIYKIIRPHVDSLLADSRQGSRGEPGRPFQVYHT